MESIVSVLCLPFHESTMPDPLLSSKRWSAAWFWLGLLFLALAWGCSSEVDAGVISTGNAGRIEGFVTRDNQGVLVATRLVKVRQGFDSLVDSLWTDTSGAFEFRQVAAGTYRVEAWQEGRLQGRSGEFSVEGGLVKDIVVVLVKPIRFTLDVSQIGVVDSMFLDYPGNPAYKQGDLWSVQGLQGSSGTLYTHVVGSSGATWLAWDVRPSGDSLVIVGVANSPYAPLIKQVDTSAFFLTPHTVALWTFDEVVDDEVIPDLSGYGNDLWLPPSGRLQSSPHGKALVARSLSANKPAMTFGDSLPASLRWARTGMETMEMRVKLDSFSLGGYVLMGSYVGPNVGVTGSGAIGIYNQVVTTGGNAWYGVVSEPNVLPVGRWMDIAVAMDRAHFDVYLWLDGQPVPLYPYVKAEGSDWVIDSLYSFDVAGGDWDARIGPFQVDEVRLSDTLVFGQGLRTQPVFIKAVSLASAGITSQSVCTTCTTFSMGSIAESSSGILLLKPEVPKIMEGNRVVHASLVVLAAPTTVSQNVFAHRLLKPLSEIAAKQGLPLAGVDYEEQPFAQGTQQAQSTGGIPIDVSLATQEWLDHPDAIKGILLKTADGSTTPISVYTSASTSKAPTLELHYR